MPLTDPELPAAYELVHLPAVHCARDEAIRLASLGAGEGTILLVDEVETLRDLQNRRRPMSPGNLHAALVLEPETPGNRDHELLYVALVSLGNAIASLVSPMTALQYGWPNEIRIATHRIGEIWLDRGGDARRRWLTLSLVVLVGSTPPDPSDSAMSLHEAEGNGEIEPLTLFEHWAREFITWINLWDERGFAHVLKTWQVRADVVDCEVSLAGARDAFSGYARGVDGRGNLIVAAADGSESCLSPTAFLGWDPSNETVS